MDELTRTKTRTERATHPMLRPGRYLTHLMEVQHRPDALRCRLVVHVLTAEPGSETKVDNTAAIILRWHPGLNSLAGNQVEVLATRTKGLCVYQCWKAATRTRRARITMRSLKRPRPRIGHHFTDARRAIVARRFY